MSRDDYKVIGPLAYAGKDGCDNVTCRRMVDRAADGTFTLGPCMGWHCSYCDAPCGMMGHRCDASQAILGKARRIAGEAGSDAA